MLVRHSIVYVCAKLVPGVIGMATTAMLTRLLDPTQYGLYGLALVVASLGSSIVFDWLGISFMRFYPARRDDPRAVDTFVGMFLMLVLFSAALAAVCAACGVFAGGQAPIYAAGLMMMWSSAWFELVARFEIADLRPGRFLNMNIFRAGLSLAGAVCAARITGDPAWTASGMALGIVCAAVMGGRRMRCGGFDIRLARLVLLFGLPMAASMAGISLVNAGTRGLIAMLDSPQALGFYTAAYLLIQNTLVVAASGIASAGYSLAVRAVETGDPAIARAQLLANATLLLAVLAPAALGMALTAHGIAAALVGPRYVGMVAALTPWMAAGAFFASIRANYLDHAFQLGERPSLQIWVTAVAAVIAIGCCLVFIPVWGPLGAAWATCAGMVAACVLAFVLGRHAYPVPLPLGQAGRILLACAAMAGVVLALPGGGALALTAQIGAGAGTYVAAAASLDVMGVRHGAGLCVLALVTRLSGRLA